MDRVKGLGSFALIAVIVLSALRVMHLAAPIVFPSTRLGPIEVASLDDVRRLVGFAPMVPAYRPATLGDQPVRVTVVLSPRPTFMIVWQQGDQFLSVTERQGGARPSASLVSKPLLDVAGSEWWMDRDRCHLVLERGAFWIEIETSLPPSELRRFADTLAPY
jgi:hypothetical protein